MRPPSLLLARALVSLLSFPLLGGGVRADVFSIPAAAPAPLSLSPPPPPLPPTLAAALGALEAPKQDLFLTVGADKVLLPPGAAPASPDDRPGQVGEIYGLLARDFGGVMALAPPTMVVLNTKPGAPRPYDGLPAEEALTLLLAGLTPPQWAALTSEAGLGVSDLDDVTQRGYFEAVLPPGDLTGFSEYDSYIQNPNPDMVTLPAPGRGGARLRLGRRMEITVPLEVVPAWQSGPAKTPWQKTTATLKSSPGGAGYDVNSSPPVPPGTVYGAVLRETLPNNPKDADLDYSAPALKQSLSVSGIGTVGDLVARVGRAVGLELYADRHYEARRVTLVGRRTARAVDLLRAAAFCVSGTFRRVGPAYVLTDDLQGTATRRQRLARFVEEAQMARFAAVEAAGDTLATAHGGEAGLPWLGGLGFSDAQQALPRFNDSAGGDLSVPFALLTPDQQAFALDRAGQAAGSVSARLDGVGQFTLRARTHLVLLSPGAPGPFLLEFLPLSQMFQPSFASEVKERRLKAEEAAKKYPPPPPDPPPAALKSALATLPRRAVLASPRTAAEVGAVVASMKTLGLNQLWLDVFSGGHSHLDAGSLTEALARTKGTDIAVVPALDLLRWGVDAPEDARDLTVLGETSAQQEARREHYDRVTAAWMYETPFVPPADVWACPAAPAVEAALLTLARRLAATPGITTLALRGTVPQGYEHPPGANFGIGEADLGYVPALRLLFLRRDHVDPVDLDWGGTLSGGADVSLPAFGEGDTLGDAQKDWGALRDGASRDLLRRLLAAGQAAEQEKGRLRFLVQQRGNTGEADWYGLWDDPQAPLPEAPVPPPFVGPWRPSLERNYAEVAHVRSRVALDALPVWYTNSPYMIADALHRLSPGWDGLVLDATGTKGLARLAQLAGKK